MTARGVMVGYVPGRGESRSDRLYPVELRPRHLRTNLVQFGMTGAGKTVDQARRINAAVSVTCGPTFVIVGPGGNVARLALRGLYCEHGRDWVDAHVHYFKDFEHAPGLSLLDIAERVRNQPDVTSRIKAVQQETNLLLGHLRQLGDTERFDEAGMSIRLIKTAVAAAFDEEYWYENTGDPWRTSPDRVRFSSLFQVINDLKRVAANPHSRRSRPRSVRGDIDDRLAEFARMDAEMVERIATGAEKRLSVISDDIDRLILFDNTEPRFTFEAALETDDVYLFDLSSLPTTQQQLLTKILVRALWDAARNRRFDHFDRPDDWVANLFVDEAAALIGFHDLNRLLSKGRNYGLGLDLATQFPEQFKTEAGEAVWNNIIQNCGTHLFNTHNADPEFIKRFLPELSTLGEFSEFIRNMAHGRMVISLPGTRDFERPQPIEAHQGPLPAYHPDAPNCPLDPGQFDALCAELIAETSGAFGVPDWVVEGVANGWRTPRLPAAVVEQLGLRRSRDVDAALALLTHYAQEVDGHESNPWIPAATVVERLATVVQQTSESPAESAMTSSQRDDDRTRRGHRTDTDGETTAGYDERTELETLVAHLERHPDEFVQSFCRSKYLECRPSTNHNPNGSTTRGEENSSTRPGPSVSQHAKNRSESARGDLDGTAIESGIELRLTTAGRSLVSDLDTAGDSSRAGGPAHDRILTAVTTYLRSEGFHVTVVRQGGSEQPDAIASPPPTDECDVPIPELTIEAEHATASVPSKLLEKLRRAQEANRFPVFVVEADDPAAGTEVFHTARNVERVLIEPYNTIRQDEVKFYSKPKRCVTFGRGASKGGATALRPVTAADSRRTIWVGRDDAFHLIDTDDTVYASVPDFEQASRNQFPACLTYDTGARDRGAPPYAVHDQTGETHYYDDETAFRAEWLKVREPFIPERELPNPAYDRDAFAILVLVDKDSDADPETAADSALVFYRDGRLYPVSTLREGLCAGVLRSGRTVERDQVPEDAQPSSPNRVIPAEARLLSEPSEWFDRRDALEPPKPSIETVNGGIQYFAETYLCADPTDRTELAFDAIHDAYLRDGEDHGYPTLTHSPSFGRVLRQFVDFESTRKADPETNERRSFCRGIAWRKDPP